MTNPEFTIVFDKQQNQLILKSNNDKILDEHFILNVLSQQQVCNIINQRIENVLSLN